MSKSKRDVKKLWEVLMEGEPEWDEAQPITSSMINQQTMKRLAEGSDE